MSERKAPYPSYTDRSYAARPNPYVLTVCRSARLPCASYTYWKAVPEGASYRARHPSVLHPFRAEKLADVPFQRGRGQGRQGLTRLEDVQRKIGVALTD